MSCLPLRLGDDRFRGGALADHPHVFDAIRYLAGASFDRVYAEVSPNLRQGVQTEDMIRVIGKLKNGVNFSIDPSYANDEHHVGVQKDWEKYPRCVEVFMTAVDTEGVLVADLYGKTYCAQRGSRGEYLVSGLGSSGLWNRRLIVCVADFHESVYIKGHTYRVDILDDKGVVCSKELSYEECAQPVYLAVDTHPADFYRVEVFDVTSACRIAIGNPIWNRRECAN